MYFKPAGNSDWRRHLELTLAGVREKWPASPAG
jgi:hypothetical protein